MESKLSGRSSIIWIVLGGIVAIAIAFALFITLLFNPDRSNPSPGFSRTKVVLKAKVPSMNALQIESLVSRSIESGLQDIKGLQEINSASIAGQTTLSIFFYPEVGIWEARRLVREEMKEIELGLPLDVTYTLH